MVVKLAARISSAWALTPWLQRLTMILRVLETLLVLVLLLQPVLPPRPVLPAELVAPPRLMFLPQLVVLHHLVLVLLQRLFPVPLVRAPLTVPWLELNSLWRGRSLSQGSAWAFLLRRLSAHLWPLWSAHCAPLRAGLYASTLHLSSAHQHRLYLPKLEYQQIRGRPPPKEPLAVQGQVRPPPCSPMLLLVQPQTAPFWLGRRRGLCSAWQPNRPRPSLHWGRTRPMLAAMPLCVGCRRRRPTENAFLQHSYEAVHVELAVSVAAATAPMAALAATDPMEAVAALAAAAATVAVAAAAVPSTGHTWLSACPWDLH
mmetsp:Transcript_115061/g.203916  ORF Transcript_115061/g.203916 Transcript_115061/m.203916 type:complete len:315 (+) Transcript_115061:300-1244(+)